MRKQSTVASVIGAGLLLATAAFADPYNPGERALGGGLIGAGTGAVIGAIAGGGRGAGIGATVGGGLGAVSGAATTPPPPHHRYIAAPPIVPIEPDSRSFAWVATNAVSERGTKLRVDGGSPVDQEANERHSGRKVAREPLSVRRCVTLPRGGPRLTGLGLAL